MKMRIIGRVLIACCIVQLQADVLLKIVDRNGNKIKQVGVGVPFVVRLDIDRFANDDKRPEIKGLDTPDIKVEYSGTSSTIQNVSGHVTVDRVFNYTVRIDKPGKYTIGPAIVRIQGGNVESNVVTFTVGAEQIPHESQQVKNEYKLEVEATPTKMLFGEKLNVKIRAVLKNDSQISSLEEPDLSAFWVYKLSGPVKKDSYKDNYSYYTLEWEYELFPKQAGQLLIPAITATVQVISDNNSAFFTFFKNYDVKKISSNAVTIYVEPLPAHAQGLFAGTVQDVDLEINNTAITTSDGALLTLKIVGAGNLAQLDINNLKLPDGLRVYKSKADVQRYDTYYDQKTIEFVLQGLKAGVFTIEPQEFNYFDLQTKKIKTKYTRPITIHVVQSSSPAATFNDDRVHEAHEEQLWSLQNKSIVLQGINISDRLFLVLCLLPVLITLLYAGYGALLRLRKVRLLIVKHRLKRAPVDQVKDRVIDFIAIKNARKKNEIDYSYLLSLFKQPEWQAFIDDLYRYQYFNEHEALNLKEQAVQWLDRIEQL